MSFKTLAILAIIATSLVLNVAASPAPLRRNELELEDSDSVSLSELTSEEKEALGQFLEELFKALAEANNHNFRDKRHALSSEEEKALAEFYFAIFAQELQKAAEKEGFRLKRSPSA